MNIIYKYPVDIIGTTILKLPAGSIILKAANQNEKLNVWAEITDDTNTTSYRFYVIPTGGQIDSYDKTYLDTVLFVDGKFILHVYYKKE